MKLNEIKELNKLLQTGTKTKNEPASLYVDNLHTSFLEFEENYILPSTSVFEIEFPAAESFLKSLLHLAPELVANCLVLPEPRPKRDIDRLFLIKPFYTEGEIFRENSPDIWQDKLPPYAIVTSFHLMHLGGANKEEIFQPASQGKTMSVYTKRVYFSVRVVPLDSLKVHEGAVIDFSPKKYQESDFMVQISREATEGVRHTYSEIFDEVDYSKQIAIIHETLGITSGDWTLGKIFAPIAVEYLTLTARFLDPSLESIAKDFISFHQVVDLLLRPDSMTLEESARNFFFAWLRSHKAERTISPSGNMAWKILREERT
ncbi:hypothetical protein EHQ53_06675 [Leptospira langatensis]|uniref:Uncharacterized protein n=1 Tax=Leptospira langatensis TaxID=2484983 RepID=A0A5F1ZTW3_9LEPT|nr:hypothetical protein [Leptospira langatensis]TGK03127.1 hypothetical protein EHO57_07505 [Leptospira langatensis]TGL41884.1 hypothetical protein EHQ53_06675 [Leptospira langatensis]